jgi:hypothetical protein
MSSRKMMYVGGKGTGWCPTGGPREGKPTPQEVDRKRERKRKKFERRARKRGR